MHNGSKMERKYPPLIDGGSANDKIIGLVPVAAALSYPLWLSAFNSVVSGPHPEAGRYLLAGLCLSAAMAVPIIGIIVATRLSLISEQTRVHTRAKKVAFLCVAAPPMFVLLGVATGLLGIPFKDTTLWLAVWLSAGAYVTLAHPGIYSASKPPLPLVRVAHGVSALLILLFVFFHLVNHLFGWMGPEMHAAVMEWGRQVYRLPLVEVLLIGVLLTQIVSGAALVWRWSASATDGFRVFQIASGDYLAVFIVTHLNSALISARYIHDSETDWAWASGAPEGLLFDAWNIRLLPHYAFGIFFVLGHLASGLRQVVIAHGVPTAYANGLWKIGIAASAAVSALIALALCGARLPMEAL